MNPEEALRILHPFVSESEHVSVLVSAKSMATDHGYRTCELNMNEELSEGFREIAARGAKNKELRPYDPGFKPDAHEMFYLPLDDVPEIKEIAEYVTDTDQAQLFEGQEEIASGMSFYTIVIEDGDDKVSFFRKCNPKNELSKRSGLAALFSLERERFERFEERVFLFDDKVDFFIWKNHLFIDTVYFFHLIFKHFEKLSEKVAEHAGVLSDAVPISNLDEFVEACSNVPGMMSKLATAAKKPYLSRLTIDALKETAEDFDLEVGTTSDNGTEKLVFESTAKKRWLILKLFNDCYLESPMTENQYESNSHASLNGSA